MTTPIIGNAFTLRFDPRESTNAPPVTVDGEALMERLASKGFIAFRLQWYDIFDAQFAIEDDVIFICEAADELAGFSATGAIHYAHLGDGELEVTSTLHDGTVAMQVDHTPHLDQRFHQRYELSCTLRQYRAAWYRLVAALVAMAD